MMAAEELGIPVDKVRAVMADTHSLGFNRVTAGSRTTFSTGMVIVDSARKAITELCKRAAGIWGVSEDAVTFEDGHCKPASSNVGTFEPLSIAQIAAKTMATPWRHRRPFGDERHRRRPGLRAAHRRRRGRQGDRPRRRQALHGGRGRRQGDPPLQVEGQFQGGAVQGIGWALNEEYCYGEDGRMQNASFLDYRMPVASDVPMIGTEIVEVPNPKHPYGLRGVGEVPVVPTMATIANAIGQTPSASARSRCRCRRRGFSSWMDEARAEAR